MNCIFCKQPSVSSKSIEHIIPESLGNTEHVLPKGIVCDKCNNYFATKIEREVLEHDYFRSLRSRNMIYSKKGNPTGETGLIIHPEGGKVQLFRTDEGLSVDVGAGGILDLITQGKVNKLYVPIQPDDGGYNPFMSRLLAKMALEALTLLVMPAEEWEEEIFRLQLDPLREYARYGKVKGGSWPYHQRRIYEEGALFTSEAKPAGYELLHEYTIHYSEAQELFFIIAIMGMEYTINMGGPEIESYEEMVKEGNVCFLSLPD
jgi:hypothetical protein